MNLALRELLTLASVLIAAGAFIATMRIVAAKVDRHDDRIQAIELMTAETAQNVSAASRMLGAVADKLSEHSTQLSAIGERCKHHESEIDRLRDRGGAA